MSRLEIILSAFLTFSMLLNIGLFVYARTVVSKLFLISNELVDLGNIVDAFTNHLQSIYEMEMFYGDETLGGLIEHARSFNEQMETFDFIYQFAETENYEDEMETIDDKTD
tara:strand:+ start:130 stop:462 length:333 start_codon:yes stop_codon:yes gene_type:complete